MKNTLLKALLSGAVLVAAGCQTTTPAENSVGTVAEATTNGRQTLYAHRWKLTEAAGQPVAAADAQQEAHLIFQAPNRLSGSTGCNRLNASFELVGGEQMRLSPVATTRMMCPGPPAETEARLTQALGSVQAYRVTDSELQLLNGQTVLARFSATPLVSDK